MAKTNEEIEELKRGWVKDPIWDLEDSEGFEIYRGELKAFSDNKKAEWKDKAEKHRTELVNKVCPVILFTRTQENSQQLLYENCRCILEGCAWWSEQQERCDPTGMIAHVIALGNVFGQIFDLMPKEFQFRK